MKYGLLRLRQSKLVRMDKSKVLFIVGVLLSVTSVATGAASSKAMLLIDVIAASLGIASIKCKDLGELVGNPGSLFFIWLGLGCYCGSILGSLILTGTYVSFYEAGKASEERDRLSRIISKYENQKPMNKSRGKRPYYKKKKNRNYLKHND